MKAMYSIPGLSSPDCVGTHFHISGEANHESVFLLEAVPAGLDFCPLSDHKFTHSVCVYLSLGQTGQVVSVHVTSLSCHKTPLGMVLVDPTQAHTAALLTPLCFSVVIKRSGEERIFTAPLSQTFWILTHIKQALVTFKLVLGAT